MIDSGASNHMTGSKEMLTDLRPHPSNVSITYGDGSASKVLGLGKVVVTPDVSIVDIMLVKTLSYNLLSVRQLALMGFGTYFDVDIVVLMWSKTLSVAFIGHVERGLYVVDFSKKLTPTTTCLMAKADLGWLWHRRLAHVNMRSLQSIHKGEHILGLKDNVCFARDRVCRACIEGKLHEVPHKSKTIISSMRILELLHLDLFGPPTHESLSGKSIAW